MDPCVTQPAPSAEEDEWDTDGFVIPSLDIGDSGLNNADLAGVTDPKPPPKTNKEEEKIYLGPHGAPPSQAKNQEVNAAGRKQWFRHKLKEADRKFAGTAHENKVEHIRQLMGDKVSRTTMPKSSPRDWLDPHCHETEFGRYSR